MLLCRSGAEIGTAQNVGRSDKRTAYHFCNASLWAGTFFAVVLTAVFVVFSRPLIGFFHIEDAAVVESARLYLMAVSFGLIFQFVAITFTGMFNGSGNSRVPFFINCIGLGTNIVLDPVMIFVFDLGVLGAAYATVFAQFLVALAYVVYIAKGNSIFKDFRPSLKIRWEYMRQTFVWGIPIALESAIFTAIAMFISRIVASYGAVPIAAQKIGTQIESMSWMISQGFAAATASFVGQNYGAGKFSRINRGYRTALYLVCGWGAVTTAILFLFPEFLFRLFLKEPEAVAVGVSYLKILSASQLLMCVDITTAGAFRGLGKTALPSAVTIVFTALRIPMAMVLTRFWGLDGVWWAITISSNIKGILLPVCYHFYSRKHLLPLAEKEEIPPQES